MVLKLTGLKICYLLLKSLGLTSLVQEKSSRKRRRSGRQGKEKGNFYLLTLNLLFTTQSRLLMTLYEMLFENIVGKGENAGNQHFLLFPQCFISFSIQISFSKSHLFCCLQMLSIWKSLNFVVW